MYLRLPYFGKEAKLMENQIKETVNDIFQAVNLRISHSTRKPLNGIVEDLIPDPEKCNTIYKYKCHCDSVYIGKILQRFHIRSVTNKTQLKISLLHYFNSCSK